MQDTKEEVSEKPKSAPTAEKYGWIKKSSGGLLGLWKDRYIQLRKTQLVVFEDEVWSQLTALNEGQDQALGDTRSCVFHSSLQPIPFKRSSPVISRKGKCYKEESAAAF